MVIFSNIFSYFLAIVAVIYTVSQLYVLFNRGNIELNLHKKSTSTSPYREPAFKFSSEVREEKRQKIMNSIMNIKIPKGLKIFSFVFADALMCVLGCGIWDTGLTGGLKLGISVGSFVLFVYCLITIGYISYSK